MNARPNLPFGIHEQRISPTEIIIMVLALIVVLAVLILPNTGCTTVAPKPVNDHQASFDGNAQNSGLIAVLTNGDAVVSAHWRDRYNAFIFKYGAAQQIKTPDYGLTASTNNTWFATKQARSYFAVWNLKSKSQP